MALPAQPTDRRKVNRALLSCSNNKLLTRITLIEDPPNTWRWRGNDGRDYSLKRSDRTTATNDAINGLLKRI